MTLTKKQKWQNQQKKFKQNVNHVFNLKLRCWGKFYCSGCGLLLLNNDATRKKALKPCNSMEEY